MKNKDELIKLIEYWQNSVDNDKYFNRSILNDIPTNSQEIIDIVGVRRCGKSSILKLLIKALDPKAVFLYINFEDPFFIENNNPQIIEVLINTYKEYFDQGLTHVFFDEIQEIKNWEKAVRKLRDGSKYKIYITGSSATLLSGELSTLITGRHKSYTAWPLNFAEFLSFSGVNIKNKKELVVQEEKIKKLFDVFLDIGGFPAPVIGADSELLKNYFFDILEKDIIARYDIRSKDTVKKLALYLISNSGGLLSIESLKEPLNSTFQQITDYLGYLKDAFLIVEVPQFSFSLKKQSKALKKYYAIDTGLAKNVAYKFSEDKGKMLENLVLLEFLKAGKDVMYYKTSNNYEVDFVLKEKNRLNQLIQVSWTLSDSKTKSREIRSLLGAMDELKLKDAFIITYDEEDIVESVDKKIYVIPAIKFFTRSL
ncbi:MAG: hypothetical protein US83_C0002G0079 [Candidatus Falkowbacteria bacterium GW2011_GWC2_38_22]|uniref:ATPase n=1 Tax=Candidatus Falkowbacteria bacterium GW2011_GWE1_38_31 TaxID=1618638 RepID=A0A0G0JTA9_9BACT|nr:MAG: hypothetical protein US73_C0007G0079 [Candidatus Falkowbacteria bacterium GW2011_GWF2_38_1205]KKQ61990.1 MAG: hypothetical protein US83_C0002G0079 [Candidatus Falkowbacteria bacterium GW2011_GWC2_38_22]KKQ63848.1 MAG: hypothetical protein US84_C0003G0038 [Candidatus Falkowbacteria bacterium GW2011_GWF1_38_22]KKQ66105.1 MAG: hypothetical protein US87_C0003G0038 [Candidatus Falkowbacteria bacterium GW2011_GWE2_38_254]KKQ70708.1 MAG: hypothetical protein US91_C0003G0038 [Candidatus Falkowb